MKPTNFEEQNQNLGHGGNPNTGDLMNCICHDPLGLPHRVSKWIPSEEEIEEIKKGGGIYIGILGWKSPPPISVMGVDPFKKLGFKPHPKMLKLGGDGN